MQLNWELCNKYSRLLPQPELFNPRSHISHELQEFPFSVAALFPTATLSLLCSFPRTLVFLFECEHFCSAICCFTPFQCRFSSLFTFPQGSGAAFFGDSLYPLFLSRAWASWPQKSISGPSETRLAAVTPTMECR